MSPRVQPIFSDNPGSLPATYTLPPGLDLVLSSVVARFNGAAAAAAFLPCLSIYDQTGNLMARVRPDKEFAIGDTGVVTYAPFLRRAAAATPPPSGAVVSMAQLKVDNFPTGVLLTDIDFADITTSFDVAGRFGLSAGGDLEVKSPGIYALNLSMTGVTVLATDNVEFDMDWNVTSATLGTWSSQVASDEGLVFIPRNIVGVGPQDVISYTQSMAQALFGFRTGATLPAVVKFRAMVILNGVATAKTPDFLLTVVRLGAPDD